MVNPDTSYQGWTNYATWAVKLWMDNEEGDNDYWIEAATHELQHPTVNHLTDHDMTAYYLGQRMKSELDDNADLPELPSFYQDLLNGALSEVNWKEIAEAYLELAKENMSEEAEET